MEKKQTSLRQYKHYDLLMALFVTVLLMSNLLSSAKIIDLGLSLGPIAFIFDAGTLVFPISYIFGDVLTEVYGYKRARRVIWAGFGATFFMGFMVFLVGILPAEASWSDTAADNVLPAEVQDEENVGVVALDENNEPEADSKVVPLDNQWRESVGDNTYSVILGGISGLIVASLTAYFIGEFLNSFVLAKMKVWSKGKMLWSRTVGSTLIGQAADTTFFFLIATALGVFPPELLLSLIVFNYLFKVCIEILMTPITYLVVGQLKKAEQEDYFDHQTNFNPFSLSI